MARRAIFLSDLHLSTNPELDDFTRDEDFAALLGAPELQPDGGGVDLVLLGDTFDLWQSVDDREATAAEARDIDLAYDGPAEARRIDEVRARHGRWFDALARYLQQPNARAVFVVGNHDHSLVAPEVQEAIAGHLGLPPGSPKLAFPSFYEDAGLALYADHGNQYDDDNALADFAALDWQRDSAGYFFVKLFFNRIEHRDPRIENSPSGWAGIWHWLRRVANLKLLAAAIRYFWQYWHDGRVPRHVALVRGAPGPGGRADGAAAAGSPRRVSDASAPALLVGGAPPAAQAHGHFFSVDPDMEEFFRVAYDRSEDVRIAVNEILDGRERPARGDRARRGARAGALPDAERSRRRPEVPRPTGATASPPAATRGVRGGPPPDAGWAERLFVQQPWFRPRLEREAFSFVVFGHTHGAGSWRLSNGATYLNTGTWTLEGGPLPLVIAEVGPTGPSARLAAVLGGRIGAYPGAGARSVPLPEPAAPLAAARPERRPHAAQRYRQGASPRAPVLGPRSALAVKVVWGDVRRVRADVYAVGHYQGVLPQDAELALDQVVSAPGASGQELLLTRLAGCGILRGTLGDVQFFPWASRRGAVVAVAGMGPVGGFGAPQLRRLGRQLAWAILALPSARSVCSVLIGAGPGNLSVPVATEGLLLGVADALAADPRRGRLRELLLVEQRLDTAREIHAALQRLREHPELEELVTLDVAELEEPRDGGGTLGDEYCLAMTLASAAAAARPDDPAHGSVEALLKRVKGVTGFYTSAFQALHNLAPDGASARELADRLTVRRSGGSDGRREPPPSRISFVRDELGITAAALTETVVLPERRIDADPGLLDDLVAQSVDPAPEAVGALGRQLWQLAIPRDFRGYVASDRPIVFEVDRAMAAVHWELLAVGRDGAAADAVPAALAVPVARQLRTSYSPPPTAAPPLRWPLRALVVGDPGDPRRGLSLAGAQREAIAVCALLRDRGVVVDALIGAPSADRSGALAGFEPATRLAVLDRLGKGGYDLLHYAGHGDFDPRSPHDTGWVFEGGLLRARELALVDLAPRLVVANACLSALTSDALARGINATSARTEADLLPGLADEFFRRGVRNYIGTAWQVDDDGAILLAETFYRALLQDPGSAPCTIGQALRGARVALERQKDRFGALWAAYQHYGDPAAWMIAPRAATDGPAVEPAPRRRPGENGTAAARRPTARRPGARAQVTRRARA